MPVHITWHLVLFCTRLAHFIFAVYPQKWEVCDEVVDMKNRILVPVKEGGLKGVDTICWRPVSIAHWRTYYWGTSPTLEEEKELEEESKKTLYSKLWSQLCSTQVHWFILRLNMVNTWPEATHSEAYFRKEWHGVRNCINTNKWSTDIHFKVLFLSVCPLLLTILHGQSLPECQVPKMSGCATNSSSNYDIDDLPPSPCCPIHLPPPSQNNDSLPTLPPPHLALLLHFSQSVQYLFFFTHSVLITHVIDLV
jgi:hypothetical protein